MDIEIAPRPVIAMDAVASSQIAEIGHDPASNTLAVRFKQDKFAPKGSLYHYANFTAEDFQEFKSAKSIGRFHKAFIKPYHEKYPYEKIE